MTIRRDDFKTAAKRYGAVKAECESRVRRWEWATGQIYAHEPFYFEQEPDAKGRKLRARPRVLRRGIRQIGIDEDNLSVVERTFTNLPGRSYEEFFTRNANLLESIRFGDSPEKSVEAISRWHIRNGRVSKLDRLTVFAEMEKKFIYRSKRLVLIQWWTQNQYFPDGTTSTTKVFYDDTGSMRQLLWSGSRIGGEKIRDEIIYETPNAER